MSMNRAGQAQSWLPEDFGAMLDLVIAEKAIASKVATLFSTDKQKVNFPLWVSDPAVGWYNELDALALTDGDTDEVVVTPSKTAGFTVLSNELVDDSDPAIADQVALALANQIVGAIDTAFLANTTAKANDGLLAQTYTAVDTGASLANLDKFIEARYTAETHGANISHWLVRPAVAQALSQLKTATSYNTNLLDFVADGLQIAGVPVLTSTHVDSATLFWGVDSSQVRYVLRKGTTVERFPYVDHDGTYVRAITRVGWGFLNEAGIIRGYDAP